VPSTKSIMVGTMNVKNKGACWVVLGLALIFLSLILEVVFYVPDLQHPASSAVTYLGLNLLHALVKLLEVSGIAFMVLGLIHLVIETESWSEYFRERLREIVTAQSYLNTLDNDRLRALQTSILKAQFKDQQIDREGSFLSYLHSNLHPYIATPYREDVSAEVIYTDGGDHWDVFDRVTYVCRRAASGIQADVTTQIDTDEYLSIQEFKIEIQFPSTHEKRGVIEPLYDKIPEFGKELAVSLEKYNQVDGLIVSISEKYKIRKDQFQYWTMTNPTKNFDLTLNFPKEYEIQCKHMVLSPESVLATCQPGYYKAKYDFWVLPHSGIAWTFTRAATPAQTTPQGG
jgi:hypothetical protein